MILDLHPYLALLGLNDQRLFAQPPDHVEGFLRRTAQCDLLNVLGNPAFDHFS